jgi:hypothetical protein
VEEFEDVASGLSFVVRTNLSRARGTIERPDRSFVSPSKILFICESIIFLNFSTADRNGVSPSDICRSELAEGVDVGWSVFIVDMRGLIEHQEESVKCKAGDLVYALE